MTKQDPPTVILDQSNWPMHADRRSFVNAFVDELIGTEVVDRADRIRSMIATGPEKLGDRSTLEQRHRDRQRQEIEAQIAELQHRLAGLGASE